MSKVMIAPGRYVQGAGAIEEIGEHLKGLGTNALVLGGRKGLNSVRAVMEASLDLAGIAARFESFGGECSRSEIDRFVALVRQSGSDLVIGVGGGKALDTAKATAHYTGLPVAVVPTIAATDAPCSALSVIYSPDGVYESYVLFRSNPDLVLVDTAIIAKAPVCLLVSGMGDALATWFEADACARAFAGNLTGGSSTTAALSLARLCYDILMQYGYLAKLAVEQGVVTEAVEKVVEANTLLSGLGFESSGLAAAHAIHNGLTALPETHQAYHGEKVAFGTLVQMVLENRSRQELDEVLRFCSEVGLPVCLADLGVVQVSEEKIMQVSAKACSEGETIHNEPFSVSVRSVYSAILAADAIGRAQKTRIK